MNYIYVAFIDRKDDLIVSIYKTTSYDTALYLALQHNGYKNIAPPDNYGGELDYVEFCSRECYLKKVRFKQLTLTAHF